MFTAWYNEIEELGFVHREKAKQVVLPANIWARSSFEKMLELMNEHDVIMFYRGELLKYRKDDLVHEKHNNAIILYTRNAGDEVNSAIRVLDRVGADGYILKVQNKKVELLGAPVEIHDTHIENFIPVLKEGLRRLTSVPRIDGYDVKMRYFNGRYYTIHTSLNKTSRVKKFRFEEGFEDLALLVTKNMHLENLETIVVEVGEGGVFVGGRIPGTNIFVQHTKPDKINKLVERVNESGVTEYDRVFVSDNFVVFEKGKDRAGWYDSHGYFRMVEDHEWVRSIIQKHAPGALRYVDMLDKFYEMF